MMLLCSCLWDSGYLTAKPFILFITVHLTSMRLHLIGSVRRISSVNILRQKNFENRNAFKATSRFFLKKIPGIPSRKKPPFFLVYKERQHRLLPHIPAKKPLSSDSSPESHGKHFSHSIGIYYIHYTPRLSSPIRI